MINFKSIEIEDVEDFWDFLKTLDLETDDMMYEPGEREKRTNVSELKHDIQSNVIQGEDFLYMALNDNKIIGYIRAERGKFNRVRHMAYITVGILKSYRARGIGASFFEQLEKWAKENAVHRLELTVECHNKAACHLYAKSGFRVEGVRKNAMCVDRKYVDEYYMAKLF